MNNRILRYYHDGWNELPAWCNYYIEIGKWITNLKTRNTLVIVLSVPLRIFVAAFIATGYISGRNFKKRINYNKYFKMLSSLPYGTPLVFLDRGRKKIAIFKGTEMVLGEKKVKIQVENSSSGGLTYMLPPEKAGNLVVANIAEVSLPANQKGKPLPVNHDFIKAFLNVNDTTHFVMQSELDCLIIGQTATLREELTINKFCLSKRGKRIEGRLQDILIAKKFSPNAIGHHCDIVSVIRTSESAQQGSKYPLIIFDGPTAFLNGSSLFKSDIQVIVLDRTARDYPEAVRQLNQRFFQSERRAFEIQVKENIPPGVYLMTFEEGKK